MKKKILFTFLLMLPFVSVAQHSNFEDGTLNGWTNSDDSVLGLSNELYAGSNSSVGGNYLLKTCDGSVTAIGEMAIKIITQADFYDELFGWGTPFEILVKNDNAFPLHLRLGFLATDMSEFVTPSTTVAANSDWTLVNFYVINSDLIFINSGDGSIDYLNDSPLGHVAAIKIIHNEIASFDGVTETGTLKIDNFGFTLLLSLEENKKLKAKIYPNPFNDILFLEMDTINNGRLTITSIHGQELINTSFSSTNQLKIDASSIKSKGIYFLKIETALGTLTKKIVKR